MYRSTKEVQAKWEAIAIAQAFIVATCKEKMQQLAALEESMAAKDEQENEKAAHPPISCITRRDVNILMNSLHFSIV